MSERVATGVRVAYFSSLYTSKNLAADVEFSVPEFQLEGPVDVSSTNSEVALYGTHFLGPAEVQDLAEVVSRELVRSQVVVCVTTQILATMTI